MKKTCRIILRLFCFVGCILGCLSYNAPKVRVDSGEIAGGYEHTYNGRKLYSFLGIPYARPPVQNYRFEEPQPVEPWLGVWNATIAGSACLGPDYKTIAFVIKGQEDCLYLNVYTPKLRGDIESDDDLMNVVVHIHGGAFTGGEGVTYGPQYLLDHNDFVYVSINYRLGVLGFAATGDGVLPGNNGLKDQAAALRWIQRNVRAFGGNPNEVTITGMSAGASSVHYHLVSPMSKNLFNRAILQSGSAYCHWSYVENVAQKTEYIAEILGCPTSNSADIIKCLRSRPGKVIAESIIYLMPWRSYPFSPFGPTVEPANGKTPFLPDIPEKLVAYDIPLLMSVTQDEGLDQAVYILFGDDELNNNWNEYIPHLLDYNYTVLNESLRTKIAQDIRTFYFGDKVISSETKGDLTKMISDRMFGYAVSKAAQNIASKNTAPVYFHEFGYSGEYSVMTDMDPDSYSRGSGVCHGDETKYVLKVPGKHPHDNEEDAKMIKIMVDIWASFIKNGVPDLGNSTTWLPVSKNPADPFRFIKITQNQTFEHKEQSNHGNYSFWSSLPLTEFYETNMAQDINHAEL